jgi:hypothetical protein
MSQNLKTKYLENLRVYLNVYMSLSFIGIFFILISSISAIIGVFSPLCTALISLNEKSGIKEGHFITGALIFIILWFISLISIFIIWVVLYGYVYTNDHKYPKTWLVLIIFLFYLIFIFGALFTTFKISQDIMIVLKKNSDEITQDFRNSNDQVIKRIVEYSVDATLAPDTL